jgi:Na+/citrate or Na+/malate symporter
VLIGLVTTLVYTGEVKPDGPTMIAVLVLGGFTCAEIGKRIPILRNIGAAAIFATFIPSALVYYHLIPAKLESSIIEFTKATNFLYIFIATIIVGSILGMDRDVLIKGFLKVFVPLSVGSVVAALVGTAVGTALGLGNYHTFFYVVVPIMAGGVGFTIMATGFVVGRLMKMYPIETAIVNACHSGQGGTGDVAILTTANRMQLMPFAQIATRIGGAVTITAVLLILGYLK